MTIATVCGPCHYAKDKATATSQSQSRPHISRVLYLYVLLGNMEHCIVGVGLVFTVQSVAVLRISLVIIK